ncbi:hypothetical protein [Zobellia roscoffensis]|nr:hypothetical protein [Zobellia roscoffensis]
MKALYSRLIRQVDNVDVLAGIVCLVISLTIFFVTRVLNREIPL